MTGIKAEYAEETNPENMRGSADDALAGADVYIGVSQPGAVTIAGIRRMAPDAIVFAMANPTPEIFPEEIAGLAAVIATGRSDYPNQINNVLAFPGIFRGALDVRASAITKRMEVAAGHAIAAAIAEDELSAGLHRAERLQPRGRSGRRRGGRRAAEEDGVARRGAKPSKRLLSLPFRGDAKFCDAAGSRLG